ncbi:hypothetical protein H310_11572 [Aphanomyces invadans]|uniref:RING-CH-type domain-containing protein n=1 Tax=Aphanomyces invadans TaxID=157072 RepID=A0A024TMV0_9STRA|nr:hypothetical protein H310_11572 [Aphanomyces invadans]ETV94926.1 hypothetical protein H310_11572 [Aphanomyces invadans]|eukprot:XP_008876517.1 hypothetical protein H310_11572 [Aphanomyces invadans]
MFSRRASIEPSCGSMDMSREEPSSPRRNRRASAGEVFAPLLFLLGVPAPTSLSSSAPPLTQSNRKSTSPVSRFNDGGSPDVATPLAWRRKRRPTDDAAFPSMETILPNQPDVLFHPSTSARSLRAASSRTTLGSQSDTESTLDFHAASLPCETVVRVCFMCDCTEPRSSHTPPSELIPSPCKCSLSWVHVNCLNGYRETSGRNSCPVCCTTWYQGYATVSFRRSFSMSFFAPGSK